MPLVNGSKCGDPKLAQKKGEPFDYAQGRLRDTKQIVLDSREGESVSGCSLRHTVRWLRVAGAVAACALAFATTPAEAQSQATEHPSLYDTSHVEPKRTAEPPPCPDPTPGYRTIGPRCRGSSLPPSAPLIERAREAAFQFSQKLPNFICQEQMSRFTQQGRGERVPQDMVSAEIIYEDGEESYRNVKINNRSTDKHLHGYRWVVVHGRICHRTLELFSPASKAQFRSRGMSTSFGDLCPGLRLSSDGVKIHAGGCRSALRR